MQAGVPARHSALVDREAERREIRRRLDRLTDTGEPGVMVIEGDAGIGKSALVADSARVARANGVRVLTAAADAIERTTAYYAWRPVFADALGFNGEAPDPADLERRALEQIGGVPDVERLIPLLSPDPRGRSLADGGRADLMHIRLIDTRGPAVSLPPAAPPGRSLEDQVQRGMNLYRPLKSPVQMPALLETLQTPETEKAVHEPAAECSPSRRRQRRLHRFRAPSSDSDS
ncbi:MAG TPA: AAA family ATPase [Solirubrobacteraceae bacterium]|jgi:hypothetical protein|nr:AAA family ATPase [Solirubrobacteraceae bacterium]